MAPNLLGTSALFLAEATTTQEPIKSVPQPQIVQRAAKKERPKYRWEIVWRNVIAFLYLHTFALYGLYLFLFVCTWKTFFWSEFNANFVKLSFRGGSRLSIFF